MKTTAAGTLRRGAALAAALVGAGLAEAAPGETVARWRGGNWTIYRIDRPAVDHAATRYPDIQLQPGDRVVIDAGGCARGADGRWAPYTGGGALVEVPGGTDGLVPLASVLRQAITVQGGGVLRLGFLGGGAGAGYAGARAGACASEPDAFVYVGVEANLALHPPMNLVWNASDLNGIPRDPMWGQQANYPGTVPDPVAICFSVPGWFQNPVCTTQAPRYDTATWFKALICEIGATTPLAGHVNWYPATYEGPIYWSSLTWSDNDYNMNVVPPNGNGLVTSSGSTLHGEFDSTETINNFTHPWWRSFRDAVNASDSLARSMVDGKKAIVSGLAGLDCEHDCYTEIHPVWLLAIRTRQDAYKDVWAIFARNWGNEGYCSRYQHHLLLTNNQYKVSLPWRAGATGVNVAGTQFLANTSGLSWSWSTQPGQKVNATFQLAAPGSHSRIHGEMVLNWTYPVAQAAAARARFEAEAAAEAAASVRPAIDDEEGNSGERMVSDLIRGLGPSQRATFRSALGRTPRVRDAVPMAATGRARSADAAAVAPPTPTVRAIDDKARATADRRTLRALREAYGGALPGAVGEALRGLEHRLDEE